ncbi:MAG: hypothetical protein KAJ01_10415 [Candidatus Hydrogenedentes bacterium]|nr:hypothetical protein [Candidatus Hydrogenedentota bacterium]
MIKLGDKVKDRISGFEGVAIGRAEYLYGCVQILVQPESLQESGQPTASRWVDEQRFTDDSEAKVGGPQDEPPRR